MQPSDRSLPTYILNRHKAFACIRPSSLSCHSLVIPRLFYPRLCICVHICDHICTSGSWLASQKKNKPPLIHVFLPRYGASKPGSRTRRRPALLPHIVLYTKLLRLRLSWIKDAGFEIEDPVEDSFRGPFPM